MKIAVIGDNCIDVYGKSERYYLTGNAVDTAIHLSQMGLEVSMITTVGNDVYGEKMFDAFLNEGLDISHVKKGNRQTAITYMEMDGVNRVHGEYIEGVLENIIFDDDDINFASEHMLVHSAFWGKAEKVIPLIKSGSKTKISFDFADRLEDPLTENLTGSVDIGFFSYNKHDPFIEKYLKTKVERGMKIAVATLGENGSMAWDGEKLSFAEALPCKIVNTVGAGDSFIAGFLKGYLTGNSIGDSLKQGAEIASGVIQMFEPWIPGNTVVGK